MMLNIEHASDIAVVIALSIRFSPALKRIHETDERRNKNENKQGRTDKLNHESTTDVRSCVVVVGMVLPVRTA